MKFTKMHGCGNDYVYVNCLEEKINNPNKVAKFISDRHFGIGSDGMICICPSDKADFRMAMYNSDGSEGAMCGNGVRCIAKYVYDYGLTDKTTITIETKGGIKELDLTVEDGKVTWVKVDMEAPITKASQIPAIYDDLDEVIDQPVIVDGKEYNITFPAFENGHEVRLVGSPLDRDIIDGLKKDNFHITLKRTLHDGIKYYQIEELEEALEGADLILGGVSSFGLDWFCDEILPVLPEDVPLLTVTKGMVDLDDGTLVPYPHIFEQRQPEGKHINFNAIGGPCTSYELADHDDSHVAFWGKDMETLKFIKSLLTTDYYHISLSTDVVGVECVVAMKNAYALGVSLAVGLAEKRDGEIGAVHYNSQAALFGQGVKEMIHLLELIHGGPENIIHGAGDLYVTVFGGRTRKIGTLLGRGLTFDQAMEELQGVTLESIVIATRTARAVRKLAERGVVSLDDFPLLMHVDAIINEGAEVDIPWEKFTTVVE